MNLKKNAFALAICSSLMMGSLSAAASDGAMADTIVYGSIYTSNPNQDVVEAMAIKDGKYVYVGDKKGAEEYKGDKTRIIDHADGMVMAGATEAHGHYMIQSLEKIGVPAQVSSLTEIKNVLEDYIAKHPDNTVYYGAGWERVNDLEPNADIDYAAFLDAICKDKPVIIPDNDHHQALVNTKAMETIFNLRNIKIVDADKGREDTASMAGAIIMRLPDGRANGYLRDQVVMIGMRILGGEAFGKKEYDFAIEDMQKSLYSQGYTNYNDGMTNVLGPKLIEQLFIADKEGKVRINIASTLNLLTYEVQDPVVLNECLDKIEQMNKNESKYVLPVGIKIFADGVTETQTGFNDIPYVGTENYGNEIITEEDIYNLALKANSRGIGIHSHSYGNAAIHNTVNGFIRAQNEANTGVVNTMCHVMNVKDEDYSRMADNHIYVALNINWRKPFTKELRHNFSEITKIPESLLDDAYPTAKLVESGVVTASSTDAPAHNGAPTDVFGIIELASNPKDLSFFIGMSEIMQQEIKNAGFTPENFKDAEITNSYQCVPVKTAMDIMTIDGAKFLGIEKERGSIEVGKYADFILVDKNIMQCPPDEIHTTKVQEVYFEGDKVFDASAQ